MSVRTRPSPATPSPHVAVPLDERNPIPALVAALCVGEVVLVFVGVGLGVLIEAVLLVGVLAFQASSAYQWVGRAIVPLALVPLLRILSLTMALPGLEPVYWTALIGVPLTVAAVLAARSSGLSRAALGLTQAQWRPQALIGALGVPAGLGVWLAAGGTSLIPSGAGIMHALLGALLLALFVGVTEEFVFRGVIQGGLSLIYGDDAVLLTGVLYGATYLGTLSVGYAASMTLIGLVYGLVARRTGSIVGVAISHAVLIVGASIVWPILLGAP